MKECTCCHNKKSPSAFPRSQVKKDGTRQGDGHRAVCRECGSAETMSRRLAWPKARKVAYAKRQQAYMRDWKRMKPWYQKTAAANLHAKRVGAAGVLQTSEVEKVWETAGGKCWACGCPATELDHYRPINSKSGGTNTAENIRPICRECNQKRSHKWHGAEIAEKEAALLRQLKTLLNGAR